MTRQTWVLADAQNDSAVQEQVSLSQSDMPGSSGLWQVELRTLRGGLSDGVDVVEIDNGRIRLFVLPTRGMSIWKVRLGEFDLGWRSPVRGPVHPKFVPLFDPSGLGWLEGFDELLVRCGLESNGAPEFNEQGQLAYPLHGRIGNRPAHFVDLTVDDSAETITLRGIVEESRFHFQKLRLETTITLSFNSTAIHINDQVVNFGGTPAEMQMLYHINIGEPLLLPGSKFVAPVKSIVNRDQPESDNHGEWQIYGPPIAGQPEDCFYLNLNNDTEQRTEVLLQNEDGSAGVALEYDANSLPCFSLWKNLVASEDGYVTGLEPGTNYPNTRSEEKSNDRVVNLAPGETWSTDLSMNVLLTPDAVKTAEDRVAKI